MELVDKDALVKGLQELRDSLFAYVYDSGISDGVNTAIEYVVAFPACKTEIADK